MQAVLNAIHRFFLSSNIGLRFSHQVGEELLLLSAESGFFGSGIVNILEAILLVLVLLFDDLPRDHVVFGIGELPRNDVAPVGDVPEIRISPDAIAVFEEPSLFDFLDEKLADKHPGWQVFAGAFQDSGSVLLGKSVEEHEVDDSSKGVEVTGNVSGLAPADLGSHMQVTSLLSSVALGLGDRHRHTEIGNANVAASVDDNRSGPEIPDDVALVVNVVESCEKLSGMNPDPTSLHLETEAVHVNDETLDGIASSLSDFGDEEPLGLEGGGDVEDIGVLKLGHELDLVDGATDFADLDEVLLVHDPEGPEDVSVEGDAVLDHHHVGELAPGQGGDPDAGPQILLVVGEHRVVLGDGNGLDLLVGDDLGGGRVVAVLPHPLRGRGFDLDFVDDVGHGFININDKGDKIHDA